MIPFHRPAIEERIEPYNSKLLLIPTGLLTTTLEKENQFCKKIMTKSYEWKRKLWVKYELGGSQINQNLPHLVPIITVFPNVTLKEKCPG